MGAGRARARSLGASRGPGAEPRRGPGPDGWQRMRARVGGFVLLSDGYDAELASDFEGYNRYVLAKPFQESELERVLRDLEPSIPLIRHGAA